MEVYIQRNLAYGNYDNALEQVKLQLEVDPHNEFYNDVLYSIYGETKQTEQYFDTASTLFEIDQSADTGVNLATASMVSGNDDMLIEAIEKYEILSPNLKVFKLQPLLFQGELKLAESLLDDIKTIYTDFSRRAQVYDTALAYLKTNDYDISKFKKFEGTYRSGFNEQIHKYWIENNRVIQYVKHQSMFALLPAGENTLVSGFINDVAYRYDLILAANKKPIGVNFQILDYINTYSYWYWKEDEAILKAHEAFDNKNYDEALSLYETASENNPKHAYLQNMILYLKYLKDNTPEVILEQNESFVGSYGPRNFWIEDNKFFYKRKNEESELPKVELLPIGENRYMDLTRPGSIMAFEPDENGTMASKSYSFIVGPELRFEWEHNTGDGTTVNYFLKD